MKNFNTRILIREISNKYRIYKTVHQHDGVLYTSILWISNIIRL